MMPVCGCGTPLIWGGDNTYDEYGIDEEEGIVSNYSCPNDDCIVCTVIVYQKFKNI